MSELGRILVVDDEAPIREVLAECLASWSYAVDTASSGEQALAAVRRRVPDLVLLDIRMEGLDGLETLRELRRVAPGLPVIMVTANEDTELARQTLQLGAFDYVAKPFDFTYLERAVTSALVHATSASHAAEAEDAWTALVLAAFHAARSMSPPARAATGERLETAALGAARHRSSQALDEVALIVRVAIELGDLGEEAAKPVQGALAAARAALAHRG